ncbi:DUF2200 family protein [Quadrisphaera setariae]|uniref:DUF2200 domain-containing protein n=1 Tax=Quadrisphaera setariae TaxID=2593304 RepID=A0A5C8Z462_9ACTN|nr:DUF2200 family protein [Quadrisphaera setariae]TXR52882.1 DUF2200 domain-containing protein [Quadrisphaera setariae]
MPGHRIFATALADVHPLCVARAERKGRTRAEVDDAVRWLTGTTTASGGRQAGRRVLRM